ncbi:PAS domain-containing sensor histidine kinase [Candidatus Saccharibacteria bacterium]|nr:PAS domain-containing sensor histidine kinase [Candidatus Saccharibacteria bacterium]
MSLRKIFSNKKDTGVNAVGTAGDPAAQAVLAGKVINSINEGVIIIDAQNVITLINPAAVAMIGCEAPENAIGLEYLAIMRFETGEGMPVDAPQNKIVAAVNNNQAFTSREYVLINMQNQRIPVAMSVVPTDGPEADKVLTFRNISKELEEEGAQMEFISTASHEMRTPVASIEGYLGLALNPQTATIDERARKYLEEAHASSQHLGRLFQDLLDVTKLDDKKVRLHMVPVEMGEVVRNIAEAQAPAMGAKKLRYSFGATENGLDQEIYGLVDIDFLREILNNLLENAVKYTPEGGAVWVNVQGDGDRILINVTDTGMGISPEDLRHVFQKFYREDHSQTRENGGTGLGLYLVKSRAEAMGGKVWAESSFGEGSTFYVSLPRLTVEEYERQKELLANAQVMGGVALGAVTTQ